MVTVTATEDPEHAWGALSAHLEAEPLGRHLAASLLDGMRTSGPAPGARIWWVGDGPGVRGLALRTGTKRGLLVDVDDGDDAGIDALAEAIDGDGGEVSRIGGEVATAVAFAAAWAERRRVVVRTETTQVFRVLDRLVEPSPAVAGRARGGAREDLERLTDWAVGFQLDAFPARPVDRTAEAAGVATRVGQQRVWVWEAPIAPEGKRVPVAMASASPVIAGVSRIQGVYTRPEHRGRGYGAAVTAAVVAQRLSVGGATRCALFADLANPTSNGIYRRLGFRPHHQQVDLVVEAG